jgi:O-glycosyl hydrolase
MEMSRMSACNALLKAALAVACLANPEAAVAKPSYEIFPDKRRQTVLGLGVEIQSDSIGSGNHGLPDAPIAVPHDLTQAERDRFADEMLRGFRYLRLAGGLYWRGLDTQGARLRPRWPAQLAELKALVDRSGIEGLSFEYWSPAPYWKANRSYVGTGPSDPANMLRPFAEGFARDPNYKGDRNRFFSDFASAVVDDISTLECAGLKVSMFGLQNEPWISNATYSANWYSTADDYLAAFAPVARAVRAHDPNIVIFSDTNEEFPAYVAPGMSDPAIASLVDAYAVHTVGRDSATVAHVDQRIRKELPPRPWFQNEYEYLTGGATPARTLNTVQHIMNSFQVGRNPTWFWLHALKPVGNAEASGYALGFWNSLISPAAPQKGDLRVRWHAGPQISDLPQDLSVFEMVYGRGGAPGKPGAAYNFILDRPAKVFLLAEERGGYRPAGWVDTGRRLKRGDRFDHLYVRNFPAGRVDVPAHEGTEGGQYGPPHVAFVASAGKGAPAVQIGVNTPAYVRSQLIEMARTTSSIKAGHWAFNDLNWNAVGSFVKRMPWNSVVLELRDDRNDDDARMLVFQKPNGKRVFVLSNRKANDINFSIDTNLSRKWQGFRYKPTNGGVDTMGSRIATKDGETLNLVVPALSWEFWEEQ